jgi:hypothetical protein
MGSIKRYRTLLVALTLGAALAFASSASGVGRYVDRSGDAGAAPDLGIVTVGSDAQGQIAFVIGAATFGGSNGGLLLFVNSDANLATGAPNTLGADHLLFVDDAERAYEFGSWTGAAWNWDTPSSSVSIRSTGSALLIGIHRAELGGTNGFTFWVRSVVGDGNEGQYDDAPDDGSWSYSLSAGGPDIQRIVTKTVPAAPRAGRQFTVTPTELQLPPRGELLETRPAPESYSCVATLAGRAIRGTGTGACTFRLAKAGRGKTLVVSVTVHYQGASKTSRLTYKVRR